MARLRLRTQSGSDWNARFPARCVLLTIAQALSVLKLWRCLFTFTAENSFEGATEGCVEHGVDDGVHEGGEVAEPREHGENVGGCCACA